MLLLLNNEYMGEGIAFNLSFIYQEKQSQMIIDQEDLPFIYPTHNLFLFQKQLSTFHDIYLGQALSLNIHLNMLH